MVHLTPDQIERYTFRVRRRGYDTTEVRELLRRVADQIRADAAPDDASASSTAAQENAIAAAEAEAERIIARAEKTARSRSDAVLLETQARLDALLEQERAARRRLESHPVAESGVVVESAPASRHDPEPVEPSLAEFMKAAVRDDVR